MTALGLAAARSVESGRPDRLIDDPYARMLFEAAGSRLPMRVEWPDDLSAVTPAEALHLHGSRYIGIRTRFCDDALQAAAGGQVRQAVLLGAGLDTRPQRLELPAALKLYELDATDVLAFKCETLAANGISARCQVAHVGADLAGDWSSALLQAGFSPERPTAWIAEGLMPYLDSEAQARLIKGIESASAPGSTLAFDQVTGGDIRGLSQRSGINMESLLATTDGVETLVDLLAGLRWSTQEQSAEALADGYGRDLSDPFASSEGSNASPPWLNTVFVQAGKTSAD